MNPQLYKTFLNQLDAFLDGTVVDENQSAREMTRFIIKNNRHYAEQCNTLIHRFKSEGVFVRKLRLMYLIDSLIKSDETGDYARMFTLYLYDFYCELFTNADKVVQMRLFKIYYTWKYLVDKEVLERINRKLNLRNGMIPIMEQVEPGKLAQYEKYIESQRIERENRLRKKNEEEDVSPQRKEFSDGEEGSKKEVKVERSRNVNNSSNNDQMEQVKNYMKMLQMQSEKEKEKEREEDIKKKSYGSKSLKARKIMKNVNTTTTSASAVTMTSNGNSNKHAMLAKTQNTSNNNNQYIGRKRTSSPLSSHSHHSHHSHHASSHSSHSGNQSDLNTLNTNNTNNSNNMNNNNNNNGTAAHIFNSLIPNIHPSLFQNIPQNQLQTLLKYIPLNNLLSQQQQHPSIQQHLPPRMPHSLPTTTTLHPNALQSQFDLILTDHCINSKHLLNTSKPFFSSLSLFFSDTTKHLTLPSTLTGEALFASTSLYENIHKQVYTSLFEKLRNVCNVCGFHSKIYAKYVEHLDTHFHYNYLKHTSKNKVLNRKEGCTKASWISGTYLRVKDTYLLDSILYYKNDAERPQSGMNVSKIKEVKDDNEELIAPVGKKEDEVCGYCGEEFKRKFVEKYWYWFYVNVVVVMKSEEGKERMLVHEKCFEEYKEMVRCGIGEDKEGEE